MIMSSKLKAECIQVVARFGSIRLTEGQLDKIISTVPNLKEQLIWFDSPFDTIDRDCLLDAAAMYIVGRGWPSNWEDEEVACNFFKEYRRSALEKGYEVLS